MDTKSIIKHFEKTKLKYLEMKSFSQLPGIYAIFFSGKTFPLFEEVKTNQLIYIGKTESSQESRDAKTHFQTGKTGSSTVRKSIGAILNEIIKLNPIERNEVDFKKGRTSHFKFDEKSEKEISNWMNHNLSLAFYEFPKTKFELEELEEVLIQSVCPILNLSKNANNPYKDRIKELRQNCAVIAHSGSISNLSLEIESHETKNLKKKSKASGAVVTIDNVTSSDASSKQIRIVQGCKHIFPDEKLGNPQIYNINLIQNGKEYSGTYKIGSKDGKSRSGILKSSFFAEKNICEGMRFKLTRLDVKSYSIELI